MDIKWRFPGNNFTNETGLDTSNMEMFKRDPLSSLAREICQNSIDARQDYNKPVKVSFSLFTMDSHLIPEISRLKKELKSCQDYMKDNEDKSSEIAMMLSSISKNKITVLRISDFNATGLLGVSDSLNSSMPWYLLTKGSGISQKKGTTGGSKGIGKYASFLSSSFRTVFYSTYTNIEERGYQGIAYYMSTYSENNPEEKTSGVGFYGASDKNEAISGELNFDKTFSRNNGEYGTDIYIFGFEYEEWEKEVISKTLESFMVAIKNNDLIVDVNKQILSNDTIHEIIDKNILLRKKDYKTIYAQYNLLYDENNHHEKYYLDGLGEFDIYIKSYNHKESHLATNSCIMVRYPYMKIKELKKLTHIPHSAMCIINKDKLNERLRAVENPEHIDWEFNRIKNNEEKKALILDFGKLKTLIVEEIKKYLLSSDTAKTDIEGASDYLPDNQEGNDDKKEKTELVHVSKINKIKVKPSPGLDTSDEEESIEPTEGGTGEGEGDGYRGGKGGGNGGGGFTTPGVSTEGDSQTLVKEKLKGITHKFFVVDKSKNKYSLIILPPMDEKQVLYEMHFLDDNNKKAKLKINNVVINGIPVVKSTSQYIHFKTNEKIKIDFNVEIKYKFTIEVDFYAIK